MHCATGAYVVAAFYLPNRDFYTLFQGIDTADVHANIRTGMVYALLELASFLLFTLVLRRKIRVRVFHQLAFALESHWVRVQAKIFVWVLFTIQLPLEHFGTTDTLCCFECGRSSVATLE